MPPDRGTVQSWPETETARLLVTVEAPGERDLSVDNSLPGWTLGHLLTHIVRNADALCNLLRWAHTGVETPMYASRQRRNDDIDCGATRPGGAIRADVADSAARLRAVTDELRPEDWNHDVVTAQGRPIPAMQVPWLLLREAAVHYVDLEASFDDMAPGLIRALLEDVTNSTWTKPGWPSLRIETVEGDTIEIGSSTVEVTGAQTTPLAWLTRRSAGQQLIPSSSALPDLPAWL